MLKPAGRISQPVQAETKQTQVQTVTRTVVKTVKPDGTVVVKEVEKKQDKTKTAAKPLPRPDYRVGLHTGIDLRPTVSAGRRLFGSLWVESTFKPSTKDVTIGLSYEFSVHPT